jgi:hypothetical protein
VIGEAILYEPVKIFFKHISRAFFGGFQFGFAGGGAPSTAGCGW